MEKTVFSLDDLAARWGYSRSTIKTMEHEGKLHRLPNMPGVRFSVAEVLQLESIGTDVKGLTAYERWHMQNEINDLRAQVQTLKGKLLQISTILQGMEV